MDTRQNTGMGIFRTGRGPVRVQRVTRQSPVSRGRNATSLAVSVPNGRRTGDFHRAAILVASLGALLCGMFLGGYGVHARIEAIQERNIRQLWQIASAARAELRDGAVLFAPLGGNVCRRRWIDNASWTLRDGGEIECENTLNWNSTVPDVQHRVGLRLDAVRNTFRGKSASLE
jgi:hypothetical protein